MNCSKCNATNPDNSKFCNECGNALDPNIQLQNKAEIDNLLARLSNIANIASAQAEEINQSKLENNIKIAARFAIFSSSKMVLEAQSAIVEYLAKQKNIDIDLSTLD